MARLTLSRELLGGLERLRQLTDEQIVVLANDLPPALLRPKDLVDALRRADVPSSGQVSRTLQSLAMLTAEHSVETVLQDVYRSLKGAWPDADIDDFQKRQAALVKLLSAPGLLTLAKATRLQYDHANILTETHIVTDVRPVFDRDATTPLAAVICHTLRVAYEDSGTHRHLTLALDTRDLRRLVDDATRALRKAEALQRYLDTPARLPSRIAGEEDGT